MEQALAEACDADTPSNVDTGELIRVEEMLAIATDAAQRAIALRRERREATRTRRPRPGAELGAAEAAARPGAAHRGFMDTSGVRWDVYAVYPDAEFSPKLRGSFQGGWLCFDSGPEKRRLSPIPDGWQNLADGELEQLVDRAERSRPRRGRRSDGDEPTPPDTQRPSGE
jgi:hypothetical protein